MGEFELYQKVTIPENPALIQADAYLDPNDISGLVLFFLSDLSEKITGQNFIIDDGFML